MCNSASTSTSPGTFKSIEENIHMQSSLPSSPLNNKIKSMTSNAVDLTKEHDELLDSTEDEEPTPIKTLLSIITEGERYITSVERNAVAYRDSTAELHAKLRVADMELKESATAFIAEIEYLKKDVKARENEAARLRGETDKLRGVIDRLIREKDKIAKLVQRNSELESTMEEQSAKLKEPEDWRMQMQRMLSRGC